MTPEDLRTRAEILDHDGLEALQRGDKSAALKAFSEAQLCKEVASELEVKLGSAPSPPVAKPLQSVPSVLPGPRLTGRTGRPAESNHPFVLALEAKGLSVAGWALSHGISRHLVNGWISSGHRARRIPLEWANLIQKELGIPATDATWPAGIRR